MTPPAQAERGRAAQGRTATPVKAPPAQEQPGPQQGRGKAGDRKQHGAVPPGTKGGKGSSGKGSKGLLAPGAQPGSPAPGTGPGRRGTRARPGGKKKRKLLSVPALAAVGIGVVVVGAGAVIFMSGSGNGQTQAHVLTTPNSLGCYVEDPQLAVQMQAKTLQEEIINRSSGTARDVIYAVYEDSTCADAAASPQVILFIGGKLVGTSASSFISGFSGSLQGATPTSPGALGGDAACAPSVDGRPAECAWADNDTFGALTSANLDAASLAKQMRLMRPSIELPVHPGSKAQATTPAAKASASP
jgi:hypothetical protein